MGSIKLNKSKIIVISGPSGSGKTTISKRLVQKIDNLFFVTTHTTRAPRSGEVNGLDYHFVSQVEFLNLKKNDFFIEDAEVFSHFYGISFNEINKHLNSNQNILLEIDWQGARRVREVYAEKCYSIFIQTKDLKELENRLILRGKDKPEVVQKRMEQAQFEITKADAYDIQLINQELDKTFQIIKVKIQAFLS